MKARLLAGFVIAVLANFVVSAQAPGRGAAADPSLGKPPSANPGRGKVEIVMVVGCVRQQGADWMLVAATDPLVSTANAPAHADVPTTPPAGKNTFKLTGTGEFAMPTHKDHTVLVKALYNKAMPVTLLNVTSLVEAVSSCSADAPK